MMIYGLSILLVTFLYIRRFKNIVAGAAFAVCVLLSSQSFADTVTLNPGTNSVFDLATDTEFFIDDTGTLSIDDLVLRPPDFSPVTTKFIDFGLSENRVWLKVSVYSTAKDATVWRFDTGRQFNEEIDIFIIRAGEPARQVLRHRISDPFSARPIASRTVSVDIPMPESEIVDIYVGYKSSSTTYLPIAIGTPEAIVGIRAHEAGIDSMVNGALLAMLLLGFLMVPIIGWRISLAFCAYIITGTLYVAHADGYTFQYLWPNSPSLNDALNLTFMLLMAAAGFNFSRSLFQFKTKWPAYNIFMLVCVGISVTLAALALFFTHVLWLMIFAYSVVPIGIVIQLITGGLCYRRKFLGSGPFLIGSSFVALSLIYASVAHFFPGDFNLDKTLDVGHLALLGEGFAFAGAVVVRIIGLRKERDNAMNAELAATKEKLAMSSALSNAQKNYVEAKALSKQRREQLASVSHDIRQPLSSLRHTLRKFAPEDESATDQMHKALDYLESLACDQIGAAQGRDIKTQADGMVETFPVSVILTNVYNMFAAEAKAKGLQFSLYSRNTMVQADAVALMRVVSNLVANAVAHTQSGGILLGVRHKGTQIAIEVWDTGNGMTCEDQDRLMNRYEKGDRSAGAGLGLSIVKDISAQQNYTFTLASTVGHGTCARISLARHI
ncbi:MAG: sensor histidine kinase [Robiginitomaculum sp.]|nr:sensor histidine kinase [Robiginitomaculum sp.]